jgi:dolichol-phosphate mannosyltransferase
MVMNTLKLSFVIPVFNEEKNLPELYERITKVIEVLKIPSQIVFIDDGSRDNSIKILQQLCEKDPRILTILFSRNFGHQTAVTAGLHYASGDAVVVMDSDLQDPPEVLPQFIQKWQEGYEVVYGIRKKRKEHIFLRFMYALFYRMLRTISSIEIPLDSGDFCLMDKKVVKLMNSIPERNRFVRGIRSWVGFKQIGIPYERDKRFAGDSKYSLSKLVKLALDGFVSFSYAPLHVVSYTGFLVSAFSLIYGLGTFFQKIFTNTTVPGYTTTIILICFLGGVQLIAIGIIGEYLGRIYDEVKNRPLYIVRGILGSTDEKGSE